MSKASSQTNLQKYRKDDGSEKLILPLRSIWLGNSLDQVIKIDAQLIFNCECSLSQIT